MDKDLMNTINKLKTEYYENEENIKEFNLILDIVIERFRWAKEITNIKNNELEESKKFKEALGPFKKISIKKFEDKKTYKTKRAIRTYFIIKAFSTYFEVDMITFVNKKIDRGGLYDLIFKEDDIQAKENDKESTEEFENALYEKVKQYNEVIQESEFYKDIQRTYTELDAKENTEFMAPMIEDIKTILDLQHGSSKTSKKSSEKERPRQEKISNLIRKFGSLVFLGEPGSGKTTCLKRYFIKGIDNYKAGGVLCIYIYLGLPNISWSQENIVNLIFLSSSTLIPKKYIEKLLLSKETRITLLLDGLNECRDNQKDALISFIQNIISKWEKINLVITSRTCYWEKNFGLPVFEVQPLTDDKQEEFLAKYLNNNIDKAEKIIDQLNKQPGGKAILNNPLTLRIIAEISKNNTELPKSRSKIYQLYFNQWFSIEKISFSKKVAMTTVSFLAVKMKIAGFSRIASLSWIKENLSEQNFNILSKLKEIGQGFLFTLKPEEETFEFVHETFQDYFAAEYIVKNPEFLKQIPNIESPKWNMVLSYAIDLDEDPSKFFIEKARELNPILVSLFFDDTIDEDNFKNGAKSFLQILLRIIHNYSNKEIKRIESEFQKNDGIYSKKPLIDFKHMLNSHQISKDRIVKLYCFIYSIVKKNDLHKFFDKGLFLWKSLSLEQQFSLINYIPDVTLFRLIDKGIIHDRPNSELVNKIIGLCTTPYRASVMINANLAKKENFKHLHEIWIDNIVRSDIKYLSTFQVISKTDYNKIKDNLISTLILKEKNKKSLGKTSTNIQELISYVSSKINTIASNEYFLKEINEWILNGTVGDAYAMIIRNIASKDDFTHRKDEWIQNATVGDAEIMIKYGIAKEYEFNHRKDEWIQNATLDDAAKMIRCEMTEDYDEFNLRKDEWIQNANINQADYMTKNEIAEGKEFIHRKDDFKHNIKELTKININKVAWLINVEIVKEKDFKELIDYWVKNADNRYAIYLIWYELAKPTDFTQRYEWIRNAEIADAENLISNEFADKEDFLDRKDEWIQNATLDDADILIRCNIAKNYDEFNLRKDEWIENATISDALKMIRNKIADNFEHRKDEWIENATISDADLLIKNKLASKKDLEKCIKNWIKNVASPFEAKPLITYKLAKTGDFDNRKDEWIEKADRRTAKLMIDIGLATKEDFEKHGLSYLIE